MTVAIKVRRPEHRIQSGEKLRVRYSLQGIRKLLRRHRSGGDTQLRQEDHIHRAFIRKGRTQQIPAHGRGNKINVAHWPHPLRRGGDKFHPLAADTVFIDLLEAIIARIDGFVSRITIKLIGRRLLQSCRIGIINHIVDSVTIREVVTGTQLLEGEVSGSIRGTVHIDMICQSICPVIVVCSLCRLENPPSARREIADLNLTRQLHAIERRRDAGHKRGEPLDQAGPDSGSNSKIIFESCITRSGGRERIHQEHTGEDVVHAGGIGIYENIRR